MTPRYETLRERAVAAGLCAGVPGLLFGLVHGGYRLDGELRGEGLIGGWFLLLARCRGSCTRRSR
jgi:hypothetical protein